MGANAGERRVVSLVTTGKADASGHEVFGCGLHDPSPRTDSELTAHSPAATTTASSTAREAPTAL